jgi:hypothetical protein
MNLHLFSKKYVKHLFEAHRSGKRGYGSQLWTLLVLSLWYGQHFENTPLKPDD